MKKYVFFSFVAAIILAILLQMNIAPPKLGYVNLFLFVIVGLYYFPLLVFAKTERNILKGRKENILFALSSYILALTSAFFAIVQIFQVESVILLGSIIAIINGLAFLFFLLSGQTCKMLFLKHLIINSLLVFFYMIQTTMSLVL